MAFHKRNHIRSNSIHIDIAKDQGTAPVRRRIGIRTVGQAQVKKEGIAGIQNNGHGIGAVEFSLVKPALVRTGAFQNALPVQAGHNLKTAVFGSSLIYSDPDSGNRKRC